MKQRNEESTSVTGDTEDSGWLPFPRHDFGSQPLTDRRREAFARALFEGIDVQAAYELAGFKRPRSNAQRMEREPRFRRASIIFAASLIEPIC